MKTNNIIALLIIFTFNSFLFAQNKPNHSFSNWDEDTIPKGYAKNDPNVTIEKSSRSIFGNESMVIYFKKPIDATESSIIGRFKFNSKPDSVLTYILSDVQNGDTVYILLSLFNEDIEDPIAESLITIKNSSDNQFYQYIEPFNYYKEKVPDSLKVEMYYRSNDPSHSTLLKIDYLNVVYNSIPFTEEEHYSPIHLYPNPTDKGYIYTVQNAGLFQEIIVKDVSLGTVIFEATPEQLLEEEIKIDLGGVKAGKYYIRYSNNSITITERIDVR